MISSNLDSLQEYLIPTQFIDSDHPKVIAYTLDQTKNKDSDLDKIVSLYYAVRDDILYDPYHVDLSTEALKASSVLERGSGFCVEKANLLAAGARVLGIPSRLGFADVKNHVGSEKLVEILQSEVFAFHGYTELYLLGKWVKATPAFNLSLCEKLKVTPLDFNGKEDSIFQEYDSKEGQKFMEYLYDHGTFADLPRKYLIDGLRQHYPHLFEADQPDSIFSLEV